MPIYSIKCAKCNYSDTIFRKVSEYNDLPDHCGDKMQRVICAPYIAPDIQPYKSMITGEMITSRSKHKEHLKDHGMVEVGNEYQEPKKREIPDLPGLKEELAARING
jgi:hypothetical protein